MSPKGKAIELLDKFYDLVNHLNHEGEVSYGIAEHNAKQCALIAADEIIKIISSVESDGIEIELTQQVNYWYKVKHEIESF